MNRPYLAPRLIVIGIFLVVLVIQLVIGLQSDPPFSEEGFLIGLLIIGGMGVVMIPVVWRAFRPAAAQSAAFRDAKLGIGTLVSARPTGTTINDQPILELVLDVETGDGPVFRASTRELIDVGTLPQLVPGVTIAVRYLPDGRIGIDPSASEESMTDILAAKRMREGKLTAQQLRVAKEGVPAQAVVMGFRPTGEVLGGEAIIHLDLRVTRPDGSSFEASRELPLPAVALPGLQPGSIVEARYLPGDEANVAVQARMR